MYEPPRSPTDWPSATCRNEVNFPPIRQGIIIGYGRPADHAYPTALDALTATFATCFA